MKITTNAKSLYSPHCGVEPSQHPSTGAYKIGIPRIAGLNLFTAADRKNGGIASYKVVIDSHHHLQLFMAGGILIHLVVSFLKQPITVSISRMYYQRIYSNAKQE